MWRVTSNDGDEFLYIGRTGSTSYLDPKPLMARLGEHFDDTAGPLLQGLRQKKVDPRTCTDFQVIAHGPLFPAIADASARAQILNWQGNVTGALEKGLCNALKRGGYRVLNTVNDSNRLCWRCWRDFTRRSSGTFPRSPAIQRNERSGTTFAASILMLAVSYRPAESETRQNLIGFLDRVDCDNRHMEFEHLKVPLVTHNRPYVNPFVRGRRPPRWLRFSSTVGGQRPVTRSVEKAAPVAGEFDWIPLPCSDGYRQFEELWVSGEGYVAEGLPVSHGHGLHGD